VEKSTIPITVPDEMNSPVFTVALTGSYVALTVVTELSTQCDNSMETTGFPAMEPANTTAPEPTAVTDWPWWAGKSTPRCPWPNGEVGGSNTEIIAEAGTPSSGRPHWGCSPAVTLDNEVRTGNIKNTGKTGTHVGTIMCSASPSTPANH
jgi:hypothetical protein